jgi:hypothetical protein
MSRTKDKTDVIQEIIYKKNKNNILVKELQTNKRPNNARTETGSDTR